ncbi:hypothetical protein [Microcystis aeruginosa]|nr:hypothetical protein [Microcystis aeruginosa]
MSKNSIPRIENLRVQNYRALQDLEMNYPAASGRGIRIKSVTR